MKYMVRESKAEQYIGLETIGAAAIIDEKLVNSAKVIAYNKSNLYIEHPTIPNTAVLIFGRNEKYVFGMLVDNMITTDNGQTVCLPEILANDRFCLKVHKNRATLIHNVDPVVFGKNQLRLEEAIISIKKYGEVLPMRKLLPDEADFVIHHGKARFDNRTANLMWISEAEHKVIHKKITQKSHAGYCYIS